MRAWKHAAVLAILAASAAPAACSADSVSPPDEPAPVPRQWSVDGIEERHILLDDGREVTCLTWVDSGYSGDGTAAGLSCDWAGAEGSE